MADFGIKATIKIGLLDSEANLPPFYPPKNRAGKIALFSSYPTTDAPD